MDVWDPVQKMRGKEVIRREQWLGAIGAALRPEITSQLALGAALVTAATVQPILAEGAESSRAKEAINSAWATVLNHVVGEFGKQLRSGIELQQKIEKLVADQLRTQRGDVSHK